MDYCTVQWPPLAPSHGCTYASRCHDVRCASQRRPYLSEAEGRYALPHHEFGLDLIALIGALRSGGHLSLPETHRDLMGRGLVISER